MSKLITKQIETISAQCLEKMSQFSAETWRIWSDTRENRTKLEGYMKGHAYQFGPSLWQPEDSDFIRMFDVCVAMYEPQATTLDFAGLLAAGERYRGPTHLDWAVTADVAMSILAREWEGSVGPGVNVKPNERLVRLRRLWSMIGNIETMSFWAAERTNRKTEETFFAWPDELAIALDISHAGRNRELTLVRRHWADLPEHNRFGRKWQRNPNFVANNIDDCEFPEDEIRRTNRAVNDALKTLSHFRD